MWVSPRSIEDTFVIAFRGFGKSYSGKTLWEIVCVSLVWFVWQERNAKIFENKERSEWEVWDLFYFYLCLGLLVPMFLEEFLFQFYILIG